MSFSDFKLTKAEKKFLKSIFHLQRLLDRIPKEHDATDERDTGTLLISLNRQELTAIRYAQSALLHIGTLAEEAEKERKV